MALGGREGARRSEGREKNMELVSKIDSYISFSHLTLFLILPKIILFYKFFEYDIVILWLGLEKQLTFNFT